MRKLHALNWICHSQENRDRFTAVIAGEAQPDDLLIRIEPSLGRAIDFAVGEKLVKWVKGNRIELTELGRSFWATLKSGGCLATETNYLKKVKSAASEKNLNSILLWKKNRN